MAKTKEQKKEILSQLQDYFERQKSVAIVDFFEMDSKKLFELRSRAKSEGCELKVVKKTLLEKLLRRLKKPELAERVAGLTTQIALCFGFKEEVAPFKLCYNLLDKLEKRESPRLIGGIINFEFINASGAKNMATLPSRDEIVAQILRSFNAPLSRLVGAMRWNIVSLLNVLENIKVAKGN